MAPFWIRHGNNILNKADLVRSSVPTKGGRNDATPDDTAMVK